MRFTHIYVVSVLRLCRYGYTLDAVAVCWFGSPTCRSFTHVYRLPAFGLRLRYRAVAVRGYICRLLALLLPAVTFLLHTRLLPFSSLPATFARCCSLRLGFTGYRGCCGWFGWLPVTTRSHVPPRTFAARLRDTLRVRRLPVTRSHTRLLRFFTLPQFTLHFACYHVTPAVTVAGLRVYHSSRLIHRSGCCRLHCDYCRCSCWLVGYVTLPVTTHAYRARFTAVGWLRLRLRFWFDLRFQFTFTGSRYTRSTRVLMQFGYRTHTVICHHVCLWLLRLHGWFYAVGFRSCRFVPLRFWFTLPTGCTHVTLRYALPRCAHGHSTRYTLRAVGLPHVGWFWLFTHALLPGCGCFTRYGSYRTRLLRLFAFTFRGYILRLPFTAHAHRHTFFVIYLGLRFTFFRLPRFYAQLRYYLCRCRVTAFGFCTAHAPQHRLPARFTITTATPTHTPHCGSVPPRFTNTWFGYAHTTVHIPPFGSAVTFCRSTLPVWFLPTPPVTPHHGSHTFTTFYSLLLPFIPHRAAVLPHLRSHRLRFATRCCRTVACPLPTHTHTRTQVVPVWFAVCTVAVCGYIYCHRCVHHAFYTLRLL